MIERVLAVGFRGRLCMLAMLVTVSVLAATQLPRLKIDRGDERLVSADDRGWPALRRLQQDFGAEQTVLIYLRSADLWTTERLTALQDTVFALEDTPGINSVNSLLSATNIRDKGDFVDAGPLVDIVPKTAEGLAEIRDDALYGPLIRGIYVSDDAQATAITVSYLDQPDDPNHQLEIYRRIEAHIAPLRTQFEAVFQLGWPRLNAEIDRGLNDDLTRLVPLSVLILVATVSIFLRSPRVVPIPLITAGLTILWTLGFMAAVGIPVTLLTAILPALIIVVGSVEDVHLISSYLEGIQIGSTKLRELAVAHMAKHVGPAIVITSFTTIIGFASNVITDIPLIREFAIAAAFAMFANFIVTIAALPLMLHAFGPMVNRLRASNETPRGLIGLIVRVVERLSARHAVGVVIAVAALVIGFGAQIGDLRVNNDPMAYFSAEHPFVEDAQRVHVDLAGLQSFSVGLRADQPGWFKTVDGLRLIAEVQTLLNNQKLYDRTLSLADLMALMHQEMHQGDKTRYTAPTTQADFELYLSGMPRSELAPFVTDDYSVAQIKVRHHVSDAVKLNAAIDHLNAVLPAVLGTRATFAVAGKNLMVNRAAESLISGELKSLAIILVVIFALFSFLYTSWLAGLLALVPNVIPIVLNFGVMSVLGIPLNPGTAMVAAIAIGLAVDDTIHLMTRFGAESRRRVDERAAVLATIRGEAVPVITASVALALGFSVFGLSNFRIIAEFGLLAAGTMIYAAISDLLLMPILLRHLHLATMWDIVTLRVDPAVLARCPLFAGMSPYQVKKLILLSEIVEFAPGQTMMTQGEVSLGMFVILKGEVTVTIEKEGVQLIIDRGHVGDIFGEIAFAGIGVARTATIVAATAVTAVRLDAARAQQGLRFYPGISTRLFRNISQVLGARLLESHQRLLRTSESK